MCASKCDKFWVLGRVLCLFGAVFESLAFIFLLLAALATFGTDQLYSTDTLDNKSTGPVFKSALAFHVLASAFVCKSLFIFCLLMMYNEKTTKRGLLNITNVILTSIAEATTVTTAIIINVEIGIIDENPKDENGGDYDFGWSYTELLWTSVLFTTVALALAVTLITSAQDNDKPIACCYEPDKTTFLQTQDARQMSQYRSFDERSVGAALYSINQSPVSSLPPDNSWSNYSTMNYKSRADEESLQSTGSTNKRRSNFDSNSGSEKKRELRSIISSTEHASTLNFTEPLSY